MRKKLFWLLEIIIWLVVLSGIIIYGVCYFNEKKNNQNTYQVLFDDADGLIVGSPVRIMGVQVGCVKHILINNEKVDIVFKLDDVSMPLPKNAIATIQFSGMAGSKSLEIITSKDSSVSNEKLKIVEPIRINTLYALQEKISTSLVSFTNNILYIFDAKDIQTARNKMLEKRHLSDDLLDKTGEIQGQINTYKGLSVKGLDDFANKISNTSFINGKSPDFYIKDITSVINETDPSKLAGMAKEDSSKADSTLVNSTLKVQNLNNNLNTKDLDKSFDSAIKAVDNVSKNISEFSKDASNLQYNQNIKSLEFKLKSFNNTLQKLNRKKEVNNENQR